VVEVTVDMETGEITVDNMTDAHDCGLAVNRTLVEGQMQGSLSMGLGECLFEEVKFDSVESSTPPWGIQNTYLARYAQCKKYNSRIQ